MKQYEYQFCEIAPKGGLRAKAGDCFEECKRLIEEEAKKGWRLKQIVTPFHEKLGVYGALGYTVIFEKEID